MVHSLQETRHKGSVSKLETQSSARKRRTEMGRSVVQHTAKFTTWSDSIIMFSIAILNVVYCVDSEEFGFEKLEMEIGKKERHVSS
jgi:hypothetical protein